MRRTIVVTLLVLWLTVMTSNLRPVTAQTVAIGDDYNYTATDPSSQKWENIKQQQHTDGTRHELWVDNSYLYSENQSCQPGLDFDSTRAGCGMDATMDSVDTLPYTVSSGQRMVLTERYSPSKRVAILCWVWYPGDPLLNTHYPPDDYSMHWVGLRDSAHIGTSFVYMIVEHACIGGSNWKYGMKVYYTGTDGASHYEAWTDYVVEENQWLDVTVDIGNNGNDVRLTAKNTSTGLSYFKSISTNLGSAAASVEIAVQYRHNEFSKTDFVDARISESDFGISASPTQVYVFPGCPGISTITLQSVGGFSGSVSLSAFVSPATYTYARVIDSIVNVPSGGSAIATATVGTSASWTGTYTAVVMGVSGSTFHWTSFTVNADWDNDACSGYGQGSVASGTLITLADRSEVPVQNLHEGMQLLSYDVNTRQYANSTITRMDVVSTSNMLVIRTEDPLPLRLDNATAQRLWIRKSDGRVGWFSVTQLRVGDYLFNVLGQRWAQVLDISYVKGGIHTMYDIYNTSPFDYIANGYLDPQKNGPS